MIKIIITSDSNKHFEIPISEYQKRLGKIIEIIKLKPVKNGNDKQIIEKETDNLIQKLEKISGYKIVLNPVGKSFNTSDFYEFIEQKKSINKNIIFIIGGALGLDYSKLKKFCDFDLNLGKMTMPHSMVLLVILEQIYRLSMMKNGTKYNK